jgi:hypothetical protein
MAKPIITVERLRQVLDYNHETGIFTRRITLGATAIAGSVTSAATDAHGYRRVMVDGRRYPAHRLAWLHFHGVWPADQIDHINGSRSDNRIANLRAVTQLVNIQNQRTARRNNASGFLGVSWVKDRSKWRAQIMVSGAVLKIGHFTTPEAAHAAYIEAKRRLHAGCTI